MPKMSYSKRAAPHRITASPILPRGRPPAVARDLILTRPRCGGMISFMVAVPHASVVFADIHGFTSTCHRLTAQQLMAGAAPVPMRFSFSGLHLAQSLPDACVCV